MRIPSSLTIGEQTSAYPAPSAQRNLVPRPEIRLTLCIVWTVSRELLLISACQSFGLGNWADIAEHIGSYRTKEEVEEHYLSTYIYSPNFPLPVSHSLADSQSSYKALHS